MKCKLCRKEFKNWRKKRFCSEYCQQKNWRIENPNFYKDKIEKYGLGAGTINRYGFKLALEIYDKFNRKCAYCDKVNDLTIHHLDHKGRNYYNNGLKPNNEIKNLIVLCRKCHGSLHGKEGRGIPKTPGRWSKLGGVR